MITGYCVSCSTEVIRKIAFRTAPMCQNCQNHRTYHKNKHKYSATAKIKRQTPDGKERARRKSLKQKYGMSLEQYQNWYSLQNGCCAICNTYKPSLVVDHSHATGHKRGLLCQPCNLGLGAFQDRVEVLLNAAKYLRESPSCG